VKGLDLSKLKKVSSDRNTTIFSHDDGHQVKIAHSGLSSKFREALDKIPLHKAQGGPIQKFPDGGSVQSTDNDTDTSTGTDQPPVVVNVGTQGQQPQVQQPAPQPPQAAQQPMPQQGGSINNNGMDITPVNPGDADEQPQSPQPDQSAGGSQSDDSSPQAPDGTQPPVGAPNQRPLTEQQAEDQQGYKPPVSQELQQEADAWNQDLHNGHISPDTYGSMFAKSDTLGKIGMIFGLAAGAPSLLLHGRLFQMYQNAIDNDLKAQQQSKENAQNYLRLNQQDLMNKANVRATNVETDTKSLALAHMQMNWAALHKITQIANGMPDNSMTQAQAQQILPMLAQATANSNYSIADNAQAQLGYRQMLMGDSAGAEPEQQFQKLQRARQLMGGPAADMSKFDTERHIPNIPGQASQPIPQENRDRLTAMNQLDAKGKDLLNFVEQHKGTLNPQTRAVAQQKIEEMKNFYNDSIKGGALTQGRLGWYDEQFAKNPTDILPQIMGSTAKLKEMVNSNANRRDIELKALGFPIKQQSQQGGSGEIRYDSQGNAWKLGPSGKPVKVQ
jgi:hypothetical protein